MKIVSILNHKGGVGKSTISTNIAGYYANKEGKVVLGDFDIQQSSREWLDLRPEEAHTINPWEISDGRLTAPEKGTTHIIVDSPAGIRGDTLKKLVSISHKIIIPLKPGIFDILSTQAFLEEIVEVINTTNKKTDLCVIGNMCNPRAKSTEQLNLFIKNLELDSPTFINQGQIYVHLAAHGLTLFDAKENTFKKEIAQWMPLIEWIDK